MRRVGPPRFTPPEGEQVTVVGEYDDHNFDAHRITRANGDVIVIQEGSGPPPWAGSRQQNNIPR